MLLLRKCGSTQKNIKITRIEKTKKKHYEYKFVTNICGLAYSLRKVLQVLIPLNYDMLKRKEDPDTCTWCNPLPLNYDMLKRKEDPDT